MRVLEGGEVDGGVSRRHGGGSVALMIVVVVDDRQRRTGQLCQINSSHSDWRAPVAQMHHGTVTPPRRIASSPCKRVGLGTVTYDRREVCQ